MAVNDKTYHPVQAISVKALEDLNAFRFVSHLGSVCALDSKALGVSEVDWVTGEMASVVSLGTIAIETSTTVNVGDKITSDATGKAKPVTGSEELNGRALNSCTGAGFVTINLVP